MVMPHRHTHVTGICHQAGEAEVAKALAGKDFIFLPAGSGLDLRMSDMNGLLQSYGLDAVTQ